MSLSELEYMKSNKEYMQDCVLTSPNIVAMDNKVTQIQTKAEKRA